MDVVTYALSRKYTDKSIEGISGTLSGKNCTIASIEQVEGGNLVTFEWYSDEGESQTSTMFVQDGVLGEDAIAPTYDPTQTYNEGDLVVFENELYKLGAGTTTGEFNPNVWDLTNIENLLNTKVNSNDLSTVATSGSYNDLSDTPTIPDAQIQSDWNQTNTNAKDYIKNKPSIPEDAADISYDNTSSGLEAENVQDAIDEVLETAGKVDDIVSHGQSLVTNKISDLSSLTALGTASGAIASFSDGANLPMPTLKIGIEPQQDLHGYDAPWVGGAGKNKFDSDTVLSAFTKNNNKYVGKPSYVADNYVISGGFKTNTRYTLSYKAYNNTSTSSNFRFIFSYTDETEEIIGGFVDTTTEKVIVGTSAENKTISKIKRNYGNGVELTLYDIQLEEGSTATTFAPYSNICPISGWDECNVSVCGVNLFDKTHFKFIKSGYINSGGTWEGSTDILSYPSDALGGYWNSPMIDIEPFRGMTLSYSGFVSVAGTGRGIVDKDFNVLATLGNSAIASNTVDLSQYPTAKYLVLTFISSDYNFDNAQLEIGNQATTYTPYNGQTITIDLDGTRYGGTLDVVSGELTVDRATKTFNGTESWDIYINTGVNQLYTSVSGVKSSSKEVVTMCDKYKSISISNRSDNYNTCYSGANSICFNIENTTVADWKTYLQSNNVQVVYELATPTTIQLTPTQVNSLLQQNNVWTDCGEIIEAKYCRDLTTTINYILSQLEG